MVGFLFACAILGLIVWRVRRRRRKLLLAGLSSTRPVFSVEPPTRRITPGVKDRL